MCTKIFNSSHIAHIIGLWLLQYYYHEASGETSWTRPSGEVTRARKKQLEAGLPANWRVEFDDEGV
jgi:hypothetical protein